MLQNDFGRGALVLLINLMLVGCGNIEETSYLNIQRSIDASESKQSAVTQLLALGSTASFEGDPADLDILLLCADAPGTINLEVDWGDGSLPTQSTLNVSTVDTGPCAPNFTVCDSSGTGFDTGCTLTHIFTDDGLFTVSVAASQSPVSTVTPERTAVTTATITNRPPTIANAFRAGLSVEGETFDFSADVGDSAGVTGEIDQVIWTFASNMDSVFGPNQITCDCSAMPNCDDGSNDAICAFDGSGPAINATRSVQYLQNGVYTPELRVIDNDGASASTNFGGTFTVQNLSPQVTIASVSGGINTVLSASPVLPSCKVLEEGSIYSLSSSIRDRGTDTLNIEWDFGDGVLTSGSAEVDQLSYPNATNPLPADILNPEYDWDEGLWNNVRLRVRDQDGAEAISTTCFDVQDVDPTVFGVTASSAGLPIGSVISEGTRVRFSANASSGAEVASRDPIQGYDWYLDGVLVSSFAGDISIVAGCTFADSFCELTFLDADTSSTHTIDVEVFDEDSSTLSSAAPTPSTYTINVDNVLPVVTSALLSGDDLEEGECATLTVDFTDPALTLDGNYSLNVDWGDGSALESIVGATSGTTVSTPCHIFLDNEACGASVGPGVGVCSVSLEICEAGGLCSSATVLPVRVENAPPSVAITKPGAASIFVEGELIDLEGTFSDPGAGSDNPYVFRWDGDFVGAPVTGGPLLTSPGVVLSPGGALYDDIAGDALVTKSISLDVEDDEGAIGSDAVAFSVRDAQPQILSFSTNVSPGSEPSNGEVELDVAAETAADILTRLEVDWGDGTNDVFDSTISGVGPAGTGLITLTKSVPYANDGTYSISIKVCDEDSCIVELRNVVVTNVAPSIVSVNPTTLSGIEGDTLRIDVVANDVMADLNGLELLCDFDGAGPLPPEQSSMTAVFPNATGSCSKPCTGEETFAVEVSILDDAGDVSNTFTVPGTCANAGPVIASLFNTGPVEPNESVTIAAVVSGATGDTLTHSFNTDCMKTSATLVDDTDFIDPAPGLLTDASTVTSYAAPGLYNVCYRVCDDDNAASSCTYGLTRVEVQVSTPSVISFTPNVIPEGGTTLVAIQPVGTGPFDVRLDIDGNGLYSDAEDVSILNCMTCIQNVSFPQNLAGNALRSVPIEITDRSDSSTIEVIGEIQVTNVAPSIQPIANFVVSEKDFWSVTLNVSDPGVEDVMNFNIVDGPGSATVDSTGRVAWQPSYLELGDNIFVIEVDDGDGGRDEVTFVVRVEILDDNANGISDCFEDDQVRGVFAPFDACDERFSASDCELDSDDDGEPDCIDLNPNDFDGPGDIVLIAPTSSSNTCVVDGRPTFVFTYSVSSRSTDLLYEIEVYESESGTLVESYVHTQGTGALGTQEWWSVTPLAPGMYSWQVRVSDGLSSQLDIRQESFGVEPDCDASSDNGNGNIRPSRPLTLAPNDTLVETRTTTLTFEGASDPNDDEIRYVVEVARDPSFSDAERYEVTEPSLSVEDLADDERVYWRVYTLDEHDARSDWSIASFVVDLENDSPMGAFILHPARGIVLDEAPTHFEVGNASDVDDGVLLYQFTVCGDRECDDVIAQSNRLSEDVEYTRYTPQAFELEAGEYFWQVVVDDGRGGEQVLESEFSIRSNEDFVLTGAGCACDNTSSSEGIVILGLMLLHLHLRRFRKTP